jgi:hypothetical protein
MSNQKVKRRRSPNLVRRWVEGAALQTAWFRCASRSLQEEYENCLNDYIRSCLHADMQEEVCKGLRSGGLLAYGMLEETPDANPVLISAHLFPIPGDPIPSLLDWEGSTLTSPDARYIRIRVIRPAARTTREKRRPQSPKTPLEAAENSHTPKRKRGRYPIDGLLLTVVRSLKERGDLVGRTRKDQVQVIRELAQKTYPDWFPRASQPSQEKIYVALRAEGLVRRPPE